MKRILIVLLAAVMMLSTFACAKNGGKKPVGTTPESTTPEKDGYVFFSVDDPKNPNGLLIAYEGASDYVIVRGANASPSEVTASTELQSYLKKITNVELPIVTDDVAEVTHEIVVGKTNREEAGEFDRDELGDDGFVIKVADQKLYLVGGEQRGTLYSVYSFLEEYLGCRYYTDDAEKVPEHTTILLSNKLPENKQIPQFVVRNMWNAGQTENNAKLKLNGSYSRTNENYGAPNPRVNVNHNLYKLMAPYTENYKPVNYEENSDMFANDGYSQPCFTNPKVIEIVIENARKQLEADPTWKIFSLGLEDNQDFCTCDNCKKALEEEQGRKSGVYMRFVNAIAGALKDEFPDVLFSAFAYLHVTAPPIVTKAAENVVIVYATMDGCISHPISEDYINGCVPNGTTASRHGEFLAGWDTMCDHIFVWNYATNFHNYDAFFPNFTVMRENFKFLAESGAIGMFEQNCPEETADFIELRRYIAAKLLWNPYMTEEEYWAHVDDFLEGYYGPGWENLRNYIDFVQDKVSDICYCLYEHFEKEELYFNIRPETVNPNGTYPSDLTADMIRNYEQTDWTKYLNWYTDLTDNEYFVKGYDYFAKAWEAAENDDQRYRIEKTSLQVDYIMSSYKYLQLKHGKTNTFYKLVSAFFKDNPGVFTEEEKEFLRSAINTFARAQSEEAYVEYNKALREKLLSYGITRVKELYKDIRNPDVLDFTVPPCEWSNE